MHVLKYQMLHKNWRIRLLLYVNQAIKTDVVIHHVGQVVSGAQLACSQNRSNSLSSERAFV
jgi:hypothetical protein